MTAGPGGLTIAKVSAALVAAQAELSNPIKTRKANTGSYGYTYADLAGVIDHVRPVLAKHGLGFVQDVIVNDGKVLVSTTVMHGTGECLEFGPIAAPAPADMQKLGGAITYARRYALVAALGIAADDDDDGAAATAAVKQKPADKPKPVASDDQVSQWISAITEAPSRVVLKRIADQIAAHAVEDAVREDLLSLWQHKWEALA